LLKLQISIDSEKTVKRGGNFLKQLAILDARPSHLRNGSNGVCHQFFTESLRDALVKQHAH
jgi:hypothetical protein